MALKLFWRCEAATLDGTHDFSAGDTVADLTGSGVPPILDAAAARLGTNGLLTDDGPSYARMDAASIYSTVGCMAFWIQWKTTVPNTGLNANGINITNNADTTQIINLRAATSDELRIQIRGASTYFLTTSGITTAIDTWYFPVMRWDLPGDRVKLSIYNNSMTLITEVEDTSTDLSTFIPSGIDTLRIGNSSSHADQTWLDNVMIGDAYDDPLQDYALFTSYTDLTPAAGGHGRRAAMTGRRPTEIGRTGGAVFREKLKRLSSGLLVPAWA